MDIGLLQLACTLSYGILNNSFILFPLKTVNEVSDMWTKYYYAERRSYLLPFGSNTKNYTAWSELANFRISDKQ
jgi:hypothetical protein